MIPPTSIDGTDITGATIDGTDVTEITVDGDTVFSAAQPLPTTNLVHRYDASLSSDATSDIIDQAGNDDLTGSAARFQAAGQNGLNYLEFDGNGSSYGVSFATTLTAPVTVSAALELRDIDVTGKSDEELIHDASPFIQGGFGPIATRFNRFSVNEDFEQTLWGPNPAPTNQWVIITVSQGANEIRLDGTTEQTGWTESKDCDGAVLNHEQLGGSGRGTDWNFGEVLYYDENSSASKINDIEQYLANKWGVTI